MFLLAVSGRRKNRSQPRTINDEGSAEDSENSEAAIMNSAVSGSTEDGYAVPGGFQDSFGSGGFGSANARRRTNHTEIGNDEVQNGSGLRSSNVGRNNSTGSVNEIGGGRVDDDADGIDNANNFDETDKTDEDEDDDDDDVVRKIDNIDETGGSRDKINELGSSDNVNETGSSDNVDDKPAKSRGGRRHKKKKTRKLGSVYSAASVPMLVTEPAEHRKRRRMARVRPAAAAPQDEAAATSLSNANNPPSADNKMIANKGTL